MALIGLTVATVQPSLVVGAIFGLLALAAAALNFSKETAPRIWLKEFGYGRDRRGRGVSGSHEQLPRERLGGFHERRCAAGPR
jgi:hypothetical protein